MFVKRQNCSSFVQLLFLSSLCSLCLCGESVFANPPAASYVFPAGGRRGTTVPVHVGGLYLYKSCGFELLGPGVTASKQLHATRTVWFEGPRLPLPASQQAEDYPRDMTGEIRIAADAPLGVRYGRLWTAEGAAGGLRFVVGELPEVVEEEIDGDPVQVPVTLPVTINGRIFPREDVDVWSFAARKGQTFTAEVCAARLNSPLDSHLEVHDPHGRKVAENDDDGGADSRLRFTATEDGTYQIRINDVNFQGGPAYVYRLTVTANPVVDRVYPLGGRRGSKARFTLHGQGVPAGDMGLELPADAPRDYVHRFSIAGKAANPLSLDLDEVPEHGEAEPNDEAAQAKLVVVPAMMNGRIDRPGDMDTWSFPARKGESLTLELRARQLGSPLQGVLSVRDAAGKELARAEAANGVTDPALTFTPPAEGTYLVRVADRFRSRGGPEYAYRLRLALAAPDFRLHLSLNGPPRGGASADALTLPRGGQARLRITAERQGGFAGPIALRMAGLPAGVSASNAVIAAGQNAADITLTTTAFAAIGTAHLTIHGSASINGQTATRTATLPAGRGELAVERVLLAVALRPSFKIVGDYDLRLAPRGSTFRRRYRIERHGFSGPLEVRLADHQMRHLQGVTGPTLTVPAEADTFEYAVRLPPWMETGRTSRACILAVGVVHESGAEHTVGYSSEGQNEQVIAVVETGRLGIETDRPTVAAAPGDRATLTVKVSRGKGLAGPITLELIRPEHMRGLSAEPVVLAAGQSQASFALRFAGGPLGPFNAPVVVRATLADASGPVVAESRIEVVMEK